MKDLIILVADADAEQTIKSLLQRDKLNYLLDISLSRDSFDIIRNAKGKDGGTRKDAPALLRPFLATHKHAMVLFDYEGCGREGQLSCEEVEKELEETLIKNGWDKDNISVVVFEPEVEMWVWSGYTSPHVRKFLGWKDDSVDLENWLIQHDFKKPGELKPIRPKEAVLEIWKMNKRHPSSHYFAQLAADISKRNLDACSDRAFLKFKDSLQKWFGKV